MTKRTRLIKAEQTLRFPSDAHQCATARFARLQQRRQWFSVAATAAHVVRLRCVDAAAETAISEMEGRATVQPERRATHKA